MNDNDYNDDDYIDFSIHIIMFNWLSAIISLLLAILFFAQGTDVKADHDRELLQGSSYMFYFCIICMFYNLFKTLKHSFKKIKRKFNKKSLLK